MQRAIIQQVRFVVCPAGSWDGDSTPGEGQIKARLVFST